MVVTGWSIRQEHYSNAVRVSVALEQVNISSAAETIRISRPTVEAEEELADEPVFGVKSLLTPAQQVERDRLLQKWQLTFDPLSAGVR